MGIIMGIKFTKMQGCGNDYVYINGFSEKITEDAKPELVRRMSDRHFGIGSDGVIFINPSREADFEMEMFNADGSRSEMCGNGIRCVGKYVYDKGMTDRTEIMVESGGKVKKLELFTRDGLVEKVRVDMGAPVLRARDIPVALKKEAVVMEEIQVGGEEYRMTCVSMGNPHAVIFMENIADLPIGEKGPLFEKHSLFPNRTNTEFVKVRSRKEVDMRVWERGTGETLACGTGCCATAVACILNGFTDNKIWVNVLGGRIQVEWGGGTDSVYMTGPAAAVFEGEFYGEIK